MVPLCCVQICRLWRSCAAESVSLLMRFWAGETADEEAVPAEREQINRRAERLLDTYGNSVLRCAYSYLHNRSDAEEILQETLIQLLRTNPELTTAAHERAWLLRVAANLSKNRLRYESHRKTDELSEELIAQEREDLSFVWEAVKALPENLREVIHLYYYEGYSTAEIAKILHSKESTVRSHLSRGRARLKQVLKEGYDFEESV